MNKLYSQKGFTNLLNDVVFNKKYESFRRNLLSIDPAVTEKNDTFTLGLNAILLGQMTLHLVFSQELKTPLIGLGKGTMPHFGSMS
ncbi:hypothetical protein VBZ67_10550 [Campylobacter concisus]